MNTENPPNAGESIPDEVLVARSRRGDRAAFAEIVKRYQSLVCALAYSATGDLSTSEEVAQETFIAAWRQLNDLREPAKLRGWLGGIARQLGQNAHRRRAREAARRSEMAEDTLPANTALPSEQVVSREEAALLWRALERLPETYREPLVLFYREHQSVERVAQALELSEDVVKQRLSRGRKLLEQEVAALIAGALSRSAPGATFVLGVMGALPVMALAAKTTTATGAVLAKGGLAVKLALLASVLEPYVPLIAQVLMFITGRRSREETRELQRRNAEVQERLRQQMSVEEWTRYQARRGKAKRSRKIIYATWIGAEIGLMAWEAAIDQGDHMLVFLALQMLLPLGLIAALILSWRWYRAEDFLRVSAGQREGAAGTVQQAVGFPVHAREWRSRATLFGWPLVHVVHGRIGGSPSERRAPVRAWIAIAPVFQAIPAHGLLFAWGRLAVAPMSVGAVAIGLIAVGPLAIGGVALALAAAGWWAGGMVALGGHAAGVVAVGTISATGVWSFAGEFARGEVARALHVDDAAALAFFERSRFHELPELLMVWRHVLMLLLTLMVVLTQIRPRTKEAKAVK